MDLLKLLNATGQQDQLISAIAGQYGLDNNQANSAISGIMGALAGNVQQQAKQPAGLEGLLQLAQSGQIQEYINQPQNITNATQDGNNILSQLLGGKAESKQVAANVSQQSGISDSLIRQMLPLVATMAMGSMGKAGQSMGQNQLMTMLTSVLDQDNDGDIVDDVMNLLSKK